MSVVITLLSYTPNILNQVLIERVTESLKAAGTVTLTKRWLAFEEALDVIVDLSIPKALETLGHSLKDLPIDVIVQPLSGRVKKVLLADMESTIIDNEILDELGHYVGFKERIIEITERAMNGLMAFDESFCERLKLLSGIPVSLFEQIWLHRVRFTSGALSLVQTMRAQGALTVLVSGGLRWFTERVAKSLGFDEYYGNDLEIVDGILTGRPIFPILDKNFKEYLLTDTVQKLALTPLDVLAVGDGANDLLMLRKAGLGCAYHAKRGVAENAPYRLDHTDLTALLYAQGYDSSQILCRHESISKTHPL